LLGRQLHSAKAGVRAGLVFALVPSVSRYAQEARVYGLLMLSVVLATLLFDRALQRPSRGRFAAYAGAVALVGLAQFLGMLLVVAHGCVLLATAWALRRPGKGAEPPDSAVGPRRLIWRWLVAVAVGSLPALALALLVVTQPGQFGWIPALTWQGLVDNVGALFGAGIAAAFLLALAAVSRPQPRAGLLFAGWALVPAAALLAVSVVKPAFWYRYLVFTVPAYALLAGITLAR